MRKALLLFLLSFTGVFGWTQHLAKYSISNTGCSFYTFCDPGEFKFNPGEDSSKLYTADCENDGVLYGVICIKFPSVVKDLDSAQYYEIAYLDYLKTFFKIQKSVGYGKGNHLHNNENTRGVTDYWQDGDNQNWKIKGWTDGNFIGILYVHSKAELNEIKVNVFLDSFRMPGM